MTPIWFAVDGRTIVFTTGAETLKGRTICRDPRVALCVDDEQPPFSFVVVEGTAEVSEDPDDLLRWATVLGRRYMGPDRAEAFGRRNAVAGELLVRVRPTRISSARDVAMWEPLEHVPIPTATVGRQGAQRRGK